MIPPDAYRAVFLARFENVIQRLASYVESPSEKSIHDIRTGIRRLEAAYLIVPKPARTKASARSVALFKDFFSFNSAVRDYDIIIGKLAGYGCGPESPHVMLLQKKRLSRLLRAIRMAKKLHRSKTPEIVPDRPDPTRFAKRVLSLIRAFREFVPDVLSGKSGIEDLHSMRKTVKRLRYVLELDPDGAYADIISNMKQMQKLLGEIHDSDMFMSYVKKTKKGRKKGDLAGIVSLEQAKRDRIYGDLVLALSNYNIGVG